MKKNILFFVASIIIIYVSCNRKLVNTDKDTTTKLSERTNTYKILKVGQVKARGWMLEQMKSDLEVGYLSAFLDYCSFVNQDAFNANRMKSDEHFKGFEHLSTWWGAEPEGYVKDGLLRMAVQSNNKRFLGEAKQWMERLLEYQDKDGYIGIYPSGNEEGTRYNHENKADNAELWVQSRMFSAMLAWYEYTMDERFLIAVEKAVQLSISQYTDRNYFTLPNKGKRSGMSHAVGFFDTLEWLYRLTDKKIYSDYILKFYADFNEAPTKDDEMTIKNLLDEDLKFQKHTPHIVEGMYLPHLKASLTTDELAIKASKNAIKKAWYHFNPGGGVVGSEDVKGRQGTADTYREYCALPELIFSLNRVVSISGQTEVGDMVERVLFNAAQGARLPDLGALQYLSSDNRVHINSCGHGGRLAYDANRSTCGKNGFDPNKYKQEAVCCVASAPRILPYYIDGMWMKTIKEKGIAAMYYGPTVVDFEIDGVHVTIEEVTDYPFSDVIKFKINVEKPINFDLKLRLPEGLEDMNLSGNCKYKNSKDENFVTLNKEWENGDEVIVQFPFEIKKIPQPISRTVPRPGYYIQRGPLVYTLQFPHKLHKTFEYDNSGFHRYDVETLDRTGWDYSIDPKEKFVLKTDNSADVNKPWYKSPVYLEGNLVTPNGEYKNVKLVPEGATILRRLTFPEKE